MKTKPQLNISNSKWYLFARDDFKIVLTLWNAKDKVNRGICFHAQQYVEKILKGFLEINQVKPPRLHDLVALNELCKEIKINVPLTEDNLQFLSSVYIDTRYPPDAGLIPNGEPTYDHSMLAYQIVNDFNEWIKQISK